jgi:hypothetical protein
MRLAQERVVGAINDALKSHDVTRFTDSEDHTFTIRASGVGGTNSDGVWQLLAGKGAKVEVEVQTPPNENGAPPEVRVMQADVATFRHDKDAEQSRGRLSMTLQLTGVTVRARDRSTATKLVDRIYPGLLPNNSPLPELLKMKSQALLGEARAQLHGPGQGGPIAEAAGELERRISSLTREVAAKTHERMAIAATCIVMVLFGSLAAIHLEKRLPLVVYAWCFFPALLAVLSVNVGQSVAISSGLPGVVLIWAGLVLLAMYGLSVGRKVARH